MGGEGARGRPDQRAAPSARLLCEAPRAARVKAAAVNSEGLGIPPMLTGAFERASYSETDGTRRRFSESPLGPGFLSEHKGNAGGGRLDLFAIRNHEKI